MIKDKLKNLNKYFLNKNFEQFKEKLELLHDLPITLPAPLKAVQLEYETIVWDYDKFEAHRRHIDVHVVLKGKERVGWNYAEELEPTTDYDGSNDFQLFHGTTKDELVLREGEFLLFFPGEAHLTGGRIKQEERVQKIVYKIPMT